MNCWQSAFIETFALFSPFFYFQYTELETILGDTDRARALFELAVNQPFVDMPKVMYYNEACS